VSLAVAEFAKVWHWAWIKAHPIRCSGIVLHLLLRTLFAIFWLAAGIHKINTGWLNTDILRQIFLDRLTEIPPDAFAAGYLQEFALPMYVAVAWVVTLGELYSAAGLLLGFTTRVAAAM